MRWNNTLRDGVLASGILAPSFVREKNTLNVESHSLTRLKDFKTALRCHTPIIRLLIASGQEKEWNESFPETYFQMRVIEYLAICDQTFGRSVQIIRPHEVVVLLPSTNGEDYVSELYKLEELHAKTDRELVQLVKDKLDGALDLVRKTLDYIDNPASAEEYHRRAEKEYNSAAYLFRLIYNVGEGDRRILESKLANVRHMLDTPYGFRPMPNQGEIAELARALWRARGCPDGSPEEDWYRAEQALAAQGESLLATA
jgi:hypothetical protein